MSQSKRKQYISTLEDKKYNVAEAMEFIQASPKVKFNESIDVAINLGVDPTKSDQNVRGATTLPAGSGKPCKVAVFVEGDQANAAKEAGEPKPQIPRYIGKCFLDIAEHLSMRPNFSNYMYRQDMVMDAVENCVVYCANFDPEKSKNPFSYFTQVCWYAFIRRIGKEKRQIEICDKIISKSGYDAFFEGDQMGSFSDYNSIRDSVDQRRKGNK